MFLYSDIDNSIISGKVNRNCRDDVISSLYYKYTKKCKGVVNDIIEKSLKTNQLHFIQGLIKCKEYTDLDELFKLSCKNGQLTTAKRIYNLDNVDHHVDDEGPFIWACYNGHLDVAKWIYSLGGVDHHVDNEGPFIWACTNGHLEVAKWIYSLGGVNHHVDNHYLFRCAYCNGKLDIVNWLWTL